MPKPKNRKDIPYVAFTNDELDVLPSAKLGDSFVCPVCGLRHLLESCELSATKLSALFYKCAGRTYLGAVAGKLVARQARRETAL